MNSPHKKGRFLFGAALAAIAIIAQLAPTVVEGASTVRFVPSMYPTIQSAVDAANAGDKIIVLPGTYFEQVSIGIPLELRGSGAGTTIIRAPGILVPGQVGTNAIVEIYGGASVTMTQLTVSGPGAGTCEEGPLEDGIHVFDGAHLDLSFASVTHIHNTPISDCFPNGLGITIGDFFVSTATATIHHSEISDFAGVGIIVFNEGSSVTISDNVITGPGLSTVVATGGVEFIVGAVGTISNNVISGNACGSPALGCGPDFFNEFQVAGITAGGPGVVITKNLLYGNQVGIYAFDTAQISHNTITDNHYFGMALQDGPFTASHDKISGGVGGVAVIAAFADTTAVLDKVKITGTSGAPVQKFECCGFTATITGQ
jgi:hypothetical protein